MSYNIVDLVAFEKFMLAFLELKKSRGPVFVVLGWEEIACSGLRTDVNFPKRGPTSDLGLLHLEDQLFLFFFSENQVSSE